MAGHDHPVDPRGVAAARARLIDKEEAGRLAGLLGLLADPTRARILYALDIVEELCVGDLALALDATEDSVGYALRVLRTAGLLPPVPRVS
jgi:DNA-binding transcriptional ArsR family regulator